jgi:hypothetical protein
MDTSGASLHGIALVLAALSALALAAGVAVGGSRPVTKWTFLLGMVGLAVEAAAGFALITLTEQVDDRSPAPGPALPGRRRSQGAD